MRRRPLFGRTQVGVAITSEAVRVVALDEGAIAWWTEVSREAGDDLEALLGAALARVGRRRWWPRPAVTVAVGPGLAQTKRIQGLPATLDPRMLAGIVAEHAMRFFLKSGVPRATGGVRVDPDGSTWATAYDAWCIAMVERVCRTLGLRVPTIVPGVSVLGAAIADPATGVVAWHDGESAVEATYDGGRLVGVRRVAGQPEATAERIPTEKRAAATDLTGDMPLVPVLAVLGDTDAWTLAVAYGAARTQLRDPMAVVRDRGQAYRAGVAGAPSRRRLTAAVLTLMAAGIACLLAPGVAASRVESRATRQIAAFDSVHARTLANEQRLAQVTADLHAMQRVGAEPPARLAVLRALTEALPEGSAYTDVRLDSVGGSVTALTPRAASLLSRLERASLVVQPEIVGPVTRERVGLGEAERVSIRFRVSGDIRVAPASAAAQRVLLSSTARSSAAPGVRTP